MNHKVLLGITGSIAAYKSLELIRRLTKAGVEVAVVMTRNATQLLAPLSCQVLTGKKVIVESFDPLQTDMHHISLSRWADVMVVAPASANIIGKAASGIADDLLSTLLLSCPAPKLLVPAMDEDMWQNPVVRENVGKLTRLGVQFVMPASGELASGRIGQGRFPPLPLVYHKITSLLENRRLVANKTFLITAGRTYEKLDPMRVITNLSSGRMGTMLAYATVSRGGKLKAVFGETTAELPEIPDLVRAFDSATMEREVLKALPESDILIMAAAVGDYRPAVAQDNKIKGDSLEITLVKTPDILKKAAETKKPHQIFVGFSLESEDAMQRGWDKLAAKKLDVVVVNDPSSVNRDSTDAQLLFRNGAVKNLGRLSKWELANRLLDECISL